ncbi:treacle protein [Cyclospora cayetanensis]|uniref:Treacle protein n=1 Tax=Cyclospora cayetanensis TaxID=88456 RepID=A0A6P6S0X9_9EIME|nr:treacle protein [Cyclospora cayetanensis]
MGDDASRVAIEHAASRTLPLTAAFPPAGVKERTPAVTTKGACESHKRASGGEGVTAAAAAAAAAGGGGEACTEVTPTPVADASVASAASTAVAAATAAAAAETAGATPDVAAESEALGSAAHGLPSVWRWPGALLLGELSQLPFVEAGGSRDRGGGSLEEAAAEWLSGDAEEDSQTGGSLACTKEDAREGAQKRDHSPRRRESPPDNPETMQRRRLQERHPRRVQQLASPSRQEAQHWPQQEPWEASELEDADVAARQELSGQRHAAVMQKKKKKALPQDCNACAACQADQQQQVQPVQPVQVQQVVRSTKNAADAKELPQEQDPEQESLVNHSNTQKRGSDSSASCVDMLCRTKSLGSSGLSQPPLHEPHQEVLLSPQIPLCAADPRVVGASEEALAIRSRASSSTQLRSSGEVAATAARSDAAALEPSCGVAKSPSGAAACVGGLRFMVQTPRAAPATSGSRRSALFEPASERLGGPRQGGGGGPSSSPEEPPLPKSRKTFQAFQPCRRKSDVQALGNMPKCLRGGSREAARGESRCRSSASKKAGSSTQPKRLAVAAAGAARGGAAAASGAAAGAAGAGAADAGAQQGSLRSNSCFLGLSDAAVLLWRAAALRGEGLPTATPLRTLAGVDLEATYTVTANAVSTTHAAAQEFPAAASSASVNSAPALEDPVPCAPVRYGAGALGKGSLGIVPPLVLQDTLSPSSRDIGTPRGRPALAREYVDFLSSTSIIETSLLSPQPSPLPSVETQTTSGVGGIVVDALLGRSFEKPYEPEGR